jgi:hypothetical protein
VNTLEKFDALIPPIIGSTMRTLLEEVVDIRGTIGQCPTLKKLGGIGKYMCCTA